MPLACVSLDLDSLAHYCRIHGLPDALVPADNLRIIYQTALGRLVDLLSRVDGKATLFAIGEDLKSEVAARAAAEAHRQGFEVANHSATHDYALSRRAASAIAGELVAGAQAIAAATGAQPEGFRAPGYTLSPALYQELSRAGYAYDSSVFPAAPYYLAKAAVMGGLALVGRRSRAILDTPRVLLAPRGPYFPDPAQPYRRGTGTVVELPIATTPGLRLPFIGTFLTAAPFAAVRAAYGRLKGDALLNLELHAIDLLDDRDGIPPALARAQPDLLRSRRDKLARLAAVFTWLRDDFDLVTLREAASRYRVKNAPQRV